MIYILNFGLISNSVSTDSLSCSIRRDEVQIRSLVVRSSFSEVLQFHHDVYSSVSVRAETNDTEEARC